MAAELAGWFALGGTVWFLIGLPLGMVVGRRLRDRQPRDDRDP